MNAKRFALIAGWSVGILGGPASAEFVGVTTESHVNDGILTVEVFAEFDNPGADFMSAVAGTPASPLLIQVVGGTFYQHPYGTDRAPTGPLVDAFPLLANDTFVTIGVRCVGDPPCQPADELVLAPDDPGPSWPGFEPDRLALNNAAWAVVPTVPQRDPFDPVNCYPGDGRVLIGHYSTADGVAIQGVMLLQVVSDGEYILTVESFGEVAGLEQVFVDGDACPGPGSGTQDDPVCSIQVAIELAAGDGEIFVEPGTYFEAIDLRGKAINLHSTGGPEVTIIDGTGLSASVVTCADGEDADTVIDGFTITGGDAAEGGGMFNYGASPTVRNCIFVANYADESGGGMHNGNNSHPTVTGCTFVDNTTGYLGGGMANTSGSPTVTDCTFHGNAGVVGGGMGNFDNAPTVVNCTFTGNDASVGGAIGNVSSGPVVVNCTISDNHAFNAGGMHNVGSVPTVSNTVMWGDSPNEFGDGSAIVRYSAVMGGWPGVGNIDADPRLVDPANGDLRPAPGSPCIDRGDNAAVPPEVVADHDGAPRFMDAVFYDDAGNGGGAIVDIGAYEADELTPTALTSTNDLLWRHDSGQTFVWLMDGTQRVDQGPPGSAGSTWQIAESGDFDGDGRADILWRNTSTGQVFVWFVEGTQTADAGPAGIVGPAWQIAGVGNFDGDPEGRSDILWRHSSTGQVFIWLMDGTTRIGQGSPGTAAQQWNIADVGDFDGDGRADILWRHSSSGGVFIWFIDGTERIDAGPAGALGPEWRIVATGNFDGDMGGRSDILWRHDNGQTSVWLMNGTQRFGEGSPGAAGSLWQIAATGDLNGDGYTDIIWRHQGASGQVFAWLLEGTSRVGEGPIGSVPHAWRIIGTGDFDGE